MEQVEHKNRDIKAFLSTHVNKHCGREGETVPDHKYDPQDERFFQYTTHPPKDLQGKDVSHLVHPRCQASAHSNGYLD